MRSILSIQHDVVNEGFRELTAYTSKAGDSILSISTYIIAAVLMIGLVGVIWAIATNKPKAREAAIAWCMALIFALLFILI
jgi:VIT1/CCC1 family predicted Fe2+/Mn2+ transporter